MSEDSSSRDENKVNRSEGSGVARFDDAELDTVLSMNQLFDVLADERRRRLLCYLHRKDGDVASLVELIDYLVVQEADSVADLDTDDVAISLAHKHLPKLADVGLVEYDARSRTVRYRGGEAMASCLEKVTERRT